MSCAITTCELTGIAAGITATYLDTCQIGTRTNTASGPYQNLSWSYATAIPCGFQALSSAESGDGSQFGTNKARVRLPRGTVITADDRVRLTKKLGTTLSTAITFAVVGEPNQGAFEVSCDLQRVADAGDL